MSDLMTTLFPYLNIQTVLVGLVTILIFQRIRQRLKYKLPPGPFALPFIGNYEVVRAQFTHEKFMAYKEKYGPGFQVYFGNTRVVVLNNIKVVTEALITKKADFANRPQSPSILMMTEGGKNIAMANCTPTWKLHRAIAGKALKKYMTGSRLQTVLDQSIRECLNLMAQESGSFDPVKYMDLMVFNILDAIIFGDRAELDNPEFQHLIKLDKKVNELFGETFIEDIIPILLKIRPTAKFRRMREKINEMSQIFRRKYRHHQETFDASNLRDFTDDLIVVRREAEEEESEELLSKLTETHLIQTLLDIFYAGIDSSRITMYFAMWYMGSLPHIQSKVQEEIDKTVGKDRLPGLNDRESLQYAEATLHEIMRLGTVASTGLPHATACDTTVGGYDIPKETMVIINYWALHRDPNYWKDVETFDPKRYLDENGKLLRKTESWLPFSMGRRVCLGESVAKPELHLMFCCMLLRFNISLDPCTSREIAYDGNSSLMQPASFKIIVKERK